MVSRSLCVVAFWLVLSGCSSIPVADNAAALTVAFEWTPKSACSAISPPITVGNLPRDTRYLSVRMIDHDAPGYNHGGGEVAYVDSLNGRIPEGALKNRFSGPCPPSGAHNYEIRVDALNGAKDKIIGQGKTTRKYPG